MAPSTSMPTTRISANSTITFSVKPSAQMIRMPPRNDPGMATATSSDARRPRNSTVTSITSTTAAITLFCRSDKRVRISLDWSFMKTTPTCSGQSARVCATKSRTAATVSITFAPTVLRTSMARAGCPSMRAKLTGSLNVWRTSATSWTRSTVAPSTSTGIDMISSRRTTVPGIDTPMRPAPVSKDPAAISWLLAWIACDNCPGEMP